MGRRTAVALAAALAFSMPPSHAAGQGVIVTVGTHYYPGDARDALTVYGQTVSTLVLVQGSSLEYQNLDVSSIGHSVTSGHPFDQDAGSLFDSGDTRDINHGPVAVAGVEFLPPGVYPFFCRQLAHHMYGLLQIVGAPI